MSNNHSLIRCEARRTAQSPTRLHASGVLVGLTISSALVVALACGGKPGGNDDGDDDGSSLDAGTSPVAGPSSPQRPGEMPPPIVDDDDDTPGPTPTSTPDGGLPLDPCALADCSEETHCDSTSGQAVCVPNVCAELGCAATEVCIESATGAVCRDLTCTEDVACEPDEYCGDDGLCTQQACTPGARRCDGNTFITCDSRGMAEAAAFECGSGSSYFASNCAAGETTGCTCEDDWDCPPFTICELGTCEGTGVEPTCSLPPVPFSAEDTQVEIIWGGADEDNSDAIGSPYPSFAQVMISPVVANLDDDNEDGIIDEQDIPEIVFLSGQETQNDSILDGVLRAIHGGPTTRTVEGEQIVIKERGADYLAVCNAETDQRWLEGTGYITGDESCANSDPVLNTSGGIAVGDLDYDGIPEIVVSGEVEDDTNVRVYIFSNQGAFIAKSDPFDVVTSSVSPVDVSFPGNAAPAIANIDAQGNAEIVVGRTVLRVESPAAAPPIGDAGVVAVPVSSLTFGTIYHGDGANGANGQGPVSCIANVVDDGTAVQEIVSGTTVYRLPTEAEGGTALITVWDANDVNAASLAVGNGFCAIADVLGADQAAAPGPDNDLDGVAEVIVQSDAHLFVFNGQTGTLLRDLETVANTSAGGPPNIDDFDGDGFPEIGTAAQFGYAVYDLQAPGAACPDYPDYADRTSGARMPPAMACTAHSDCGDTSQFGCNIAAGSCVCLQNGWIQATQDASSRVTGSSVFDFNGDGAAEVVYNDECHFRVYDGLSGDVLIEEWSESITRVEYPVVADVDRDGNAEIVFGSNNESGFCTANGNADAPRELFNNGIEVWGDQRDLWVPARSIWNQHAYHVTNITESGVIPTSEPESWKLLNGRLYNTYRSNPRNYGVAPDLVVDGIQVTSPDVGCGQLGTELDIVVQIANIGDLLVGSEVIVGIYGSWDGVDFVPLLDMDGNPLQLPLGSALPPRRQLLLTIVGYEPSNNDQDRLPTQLRVVVDDTQIETECLEDNNERITDVTDGEDLPDLTILIDDTSLQCPEPTVIVTIGNQGSAPASNIQIAFYAGDPTQGGELIHTETFAGPLEAGATAELEVPIEINRGATIYAVIDPSQMIEECNDGNNTAAGPEVICSNPPVRGAR